MFMPGTVGENRAMPSRLRQMPSFNTRDRKQLKCNHFDFPYPYKSPLRHWHSASCLLKLIFNAAAEQSELESFLARRGRPPEISRLLFPLYQLIPGEARMRLIPGLMVLVSALVWLSSLSRAGGEDKPADKKADAKGWVQLFNGKDLTGWEVYPKGTGPWKVEKGILIGSGSKNSHLFTKRDDYENGYYRIEAKINDKGNSGQYFRAQFGAGYPKGYEAQINSTHPDKQKTGSLWGFAPFKEMLVKPDTWFTQEVIANGNHIIIKVNGKKTVDFTDEKNTYTKGRFALQQHDASDGVDTVVQFRKVEVKELPASSQKKP
jgi:hypothetical protein